MLSVQILDTIKALSFVEKVTLIEFLSKEVREEALNTVPDDAKEKVNFLSQDNRESRQPIKSYAGIWEDMSEDDFQDFLTEIKRVQLSTFDTNIEL